MQPSKREYLIVITVAVILSVVLVISVALSGSGIPSRGDKGSSSADADSSQGVPPSHVVVEPSNGLPFKITGVPASADIHEVSQEAQVASSAHVWQFGGDYKQIGSFPVSSDTVFGSIDEGGSGIDYAPAVIGRSGVTRLAVPEKNDSGFWEPQDGSGNAERLVWRESLIPYSSNSGVDNWRIRTWDSSSKSVVTLGTAEVLNATSSTPILSQEVVPTANGSFAYFSSLKIDGDSNWVPFVLSMSLDGKSGAVPVEPGSYPQAVADGVIFAAYDLQKNAFLELRHRADTGESKAIFKLSDTSEGSHAWQVSGIWADESHRIISFTSDDPSQGTYIGIWNGDMSSLVTWLHAPSHGAVGSLNADWFVWGAGSQGDNANMYAFSFVDGRILNLGSAQGYSRPSIARDSDTVMLPEYHGDESAVSFTVGSLQ